MWTADREDSRVQTSKPRHYIEIPRIGCSRWDLRDDPLFFDIYSDGKLAADEFGLELDGFDEARDQAVSILPGPG